MFKYIGFASVLSILLYNSVLGQNLALIPPKSIIWDFSVEHHNPIVKNFTLSESLFGSVFLPSITENFPSEYYTQIEIQNPVFEKLIGFESFKSKIKPLLSVDVKIKQYHTYEGSQLFAAYTLSPFVLKNGEVHCLKSYELVVNNTRKVEKNSTVSASKRRTTSTVLATGKWLKFSVVRDGIYKLTKSDLKAAGLDIESINPRTIKIYGHHGGMLPEDNAATRFEDLPENAIQIIGEGDGVFNDDDYIILYVQGPHKWKYNFQKQRYEHQMNYYSDKTFFFLTHGGGSGKRMNTRSNGSSLVPEKVFNWFDYHLFHDDEKENFCNEGRIWLGERFDQQTSYTFNQRLANITTDKEVSVYFEAAAVSPTLSQMSLQLNGNLVTTMFFQDLVSKYECFTDGGIRSGSIATSSPDVQLRFTYNKPNSSSRAWLNYYELHGSRLLNKEENFMPFSNLIALQHGTVEYRMQNLTSNSVVFDVTNPVEPQIQSLFTDNGQSVFRDNNSFVLKEYVLFNGDFLKPEFVEEVPNQNLHGTGIVQYIIIAPDAFKDAAIKLADYHRLKSNLQVLVVSPQLIYNEFSSGSQDISAIRDFLKLIFEGNNNPVNQLKYVLLLGDASFDYKDRISGNTNFVPTYESEPKWNIPLSFNNGYYCSDDFFGYLDSTDGLWINEQKLEVIVSRMPVSSPTEAMDMVDKVIHYKSDATLGNWRTNATLCSDDADAGWEVMFVNDFENISDFLDTTVKNLNVNKIYFDSYKQQNLSGSQRYPEVQDAIIKDFENGTLIFNYVGHGGEQYLASEKVIDIPLINGLKNINTLPVIFTATCEFSRFDDARRKSAGEYMYTNPQGGAIAMYTTTRLVYAGDNASLTNFFWTNCAYVKIGGKWPTLGEIHKKLKNRPNPSSNDRMFTLFGDPAITMNYPESIIVIDSVNGQSVVNSNDTMKALSKMNFAGHVEDVFGAPLNNFQGKINSVFFDKKSRFLTLANDNIPSTVLPFNLYSNVLFKGVNSINNGKFNIRFIVPKDINYNYGFGKISLYGADNQTDAWGHYNKILIGGTNPNALADEKGPELEIAVDDYSFVSGGVTGQTPVLLARLFDDNGINTSGNGIGRDILAIIDKGTAQEKRYILNSFYKSELNSYTNGSIEFKLNGISPGRHTYTLKAWDVYNNSNEQTLEFVVKNKDEFVIENLLNYPNPFNNRTVFHFDHNQSGETLDIDITIMTITGKVVKTISETVVSANAHITDIEWNGRDDYEDKLSKGVYIYKVNVRSSNGKKVEKIEKLVILN